MQTYYTLMMHEPPVWGTSKIVAKDINTFRKRWVDVFKKNHKPDFQMRVWLGDKWIGDLMFKGTEPIWVKADGGIRYIDPKTGRLM